MTKGFTAPARTAASVPTEFLIFEAASRSYAVRIAEVREIRGWTPVTPLPRADECVLGVVNLRGTVLPVIDLARRLGHDATPSDPRNVVVVLQFEDAHVGILVAAVSDIHLESDDAVVPPPAVETDPQTSTVSGLLIDDDTMIQVLDLAALVRPILGGGPHR